MNKRGLIYNSNIYDILSIFLLFIVTLIFFFKFRVHYNEMDVIPFAKAFFNNHWLDKDWYLNLYIPYRFFFSYPVGFFTDSFGIMQTIILGRLFSYFLMSYALHSLIKSISCSINMFLYHFAIIVFYCFFPNGNGAGEWMVGGLDTKVFAYVFSIFSLTSFINKRYLKGFFFAGLVLNFHVLIGIFHLFSILPFLFFFQKNNINFLKEFTSFITVFCLSGFFGLYCIFYQLFFPEQEASNIAWNIYVNVRVPHHTLPSFFPVQLWIKMILFSVFNLYIIYRIKTGKIRLLAFYAVSSVLISLVGLIIFFSSLENHYLRYYFFRFSDVMLPLITLLNIIILFTKYYSKFIHKYISRIKLVLVSIFFLIFFKPFNSFCNDFTINIKDIIYSDSLDLNMHDWIRSNTDQESVFITCPDDHFFYINCERSMFVSWKHSPQNSADIIFWYNRLKHLNSNKEFSNIEEIVDNYYKLKKDEILLIADKYPDVDYFLTSNLIHLDLPVAYQSNNLVLYKIVK